MAHCQITDPQNYVCPLRNVNHFHAYQTHPTDDQAFFLVIGTKTTVSIQIRAQQRVVNR